MNATVTNGTVQKHASRKQGGFTLLELLISLGFMASLAGLISGSTFLAIKTSAKTGAIADVAVETAKTTRWLVRDVHRAATTSLVDLALPVTTATFNWDDGGPVSCTLSLNGTDFIRNCGGPDFRIGKYVSNLSFDRNGNLVRASYDIVPPGAPEKIQRIDLNIALGGG